MSKSKSKNRKIWQPTKSAAKNAEIVLPPLAQRFFRDGRKAVKSSKVPEALHAFRLKVKRFRYTIELFRPCYGPGLEKRLRSLKGLQDYLGALSDLDTTATLLRQPGFRKLPERASIRQLLKSRVAENTEAFVKHWREEFDAPGQERQWATYLRSHTRKPAKPGPTATSVQVSQKIPPDRGKLLV